MNPSARAVLMAERDRLAGEIRSLSTLLKALDHFLELVPEDAPAPPREPAPGPDVAEPSAIAPSVPRAAALPQAPAPLQKLVDAATLAPLTPLQFKVFMVIADAQGKYLPSAAIDRLAGHVGAFGTLQGICNKGYLARERLPGTRKNATAFRIACFGKPRVDEKGARRGPKPRSSQSPPRHIKAAAPASPPPAHRQDGPHAPKRRVVFPPVPLPAKVTQALLGADGNGGRDTKVDQRIKVSTYLTRKGHTVGYARGGWMVDGEHLDRHEALVLINAHRQKADLHPVTVQDLE